MRRSHWHILLGLFAAAPLLGTASTAGAAELGPGIQTVSEREQSEKSDEDQTDAADSNSEDQQSDGQDSEDREETRNDGNLDSGAPGLELGSDSSETDEVLANFDKNRDAESSDNSSSHDGSQTIALSNDSADTHPCEPYPSCARADLGSREGVDASPFQKVAQKNADVIRKCYASQLDQDADLSGRLVLKFTVDAEGEPTDIQVKDSTIDSDAVAECAVDAVAEWSFPKPAEYGYDSLTVKHPYTFQTDE